jgi:NAD(P)-dependent dehydrogenase (short-subunit alcohol dehydrogenase family)
MSEMPLSGQAALVSGAASGLGAAVANQLLHSGADVITNYRSDYGVLDELIVAADKLDRRQMIVQGDVARDEASAKIRAMAAAHSPSLSAPLADDIAKTVLMLCRDDTAHVTGAHLLVDNGICLLPAV